MNSTATIEAPLEHMQAAAEATAFKPEVIEQGPAPLSRRYWLLVATPLVILAAGSASIWDFVSFSFLAAPYLNGSIFAVMAWGAWTMFGHVARTYREDRVFRAGMAWLRRGNDSGEQAPHLGEGAHVVGMLDRLNKLGLGHQVYVHSSAMEPELESLEHFFTKKQELSQYLVGLMVGLGLLGTFFGLLETLIKTSDLIGTIAKSSAGGGDMEQEFAKIVGGLQGPLTAMGTAFSASMFGLVGSIMLGLQMVIVRKAVSQFVEQVREEVLSLAERSKVSAEVEITERFLATLLADILEQHKQTTQQLGETASQMHALVPEMRQSIIATTELSASVRRQEEVLDRSVQTVGGLAKVLPVLGSLADSMRLILGNSKDAGVRVQKMLDYLPVQETLLGNVAGALDRINALADEVQTLGLSVKALGSDVRAQGLVVQRMDETLWKSERQALLSAANKGPTFASAGREGVAGAIRDDS